MLINVFDLKEQQKQLRILFLGHYLGIEVERQVDL